HEYLEKGMRVHFKSGPLAGEEGIVENANNLEKVILQVKAMRNAVSVTANAADVEVLGPYDDEDDYEEYDE
ncbi:MAG: hypothetical protein KA886_09835, partial [Candidatus Cloacimonetes bacterium]|nr:hypothetical protein [Candidatus Cloacimonadota bacterium]